MKVVYIFVALLLMGIQILVIPFLMNSWDIFFDVVAFLFFPFSLFWMIPIVLWGIWKGHYAIFGSIGGGIGILLGSFWGYEDAAFVSIFLGICCGGIVGILLDYWTKEPQNITLE